MSLTSLHPPGKAPKRLGFFTRLLDDVDPGSRYRLAIEQIVRAEQLGYDSAWVAQHHFHAAEGGLPAPLVFLAHAAARTSRIRLGTGIITLPLENPLRVAEDSAVLDLLIGGRLDIGLGTGGNPAAFAAFGLDAQARGAVFAQHLKQLRTAWRGEALDGGDRLYPSAPQLDRRVWQATFSVEGGRLAGAAGDGLMLSRTQPRPAALEGAPLSALQLPIIEAYLAALPPGVAPRIVASRTAFVAERRADALRLAERGLRAFAERCAQAGRPLTEDGSLSALIAATDTHIGTPDEVIASLQQDSTLAHAQELVFQVHSVDPPHPQILRSMELIAHHVAPALGWQRGAASEEGFALPAHRELAAA